MIYFRGECLVWALYFCLGLILKKDETAYLIFGLISVFWFFIYGPWAILTAIELVVGYSSSKMIKGNAAEAKTKSSIGDSLRAKVHTKTGEIAERAYAYIARKEYEALKPHQKRISAFSCMVKSIKL